MAKTRFTSLKKISLPRLELAAAALLVRLTRYARAVLCRPHEVHLWSDSTVALAWIHGNPTRWKTYVANRVSFIQTTLPDARWHHVPTSDNPADCATRGRSPRDLAAHDLWWRGPPWFQAEMASWPSSSWTSTTEETRASTASVNAAYRRDARLDRVVLFTFLPAAGDRLVLTTAAPPPRSPDSRYAFHRGA